MSNNVIKADGFVERDSGRCDSIAANLLRDVICLGRICASCLQAYKHELYIYILFLPYVKTK